MSSRLMRNSILVLASFLFPATACLSAHTTTAGNLDTYVGQFRSQDEPDTILSFSRVDNQLAVETARMPINKLQSVGQDTFSASNGTRFVFERDASGKIMAVKRIAGKEETLIEKIGDQPQHNHFLPYDRQEVMIPMRDGIKLHAIILRPADTKTPLPFLMQRTPYGVAASTSDVINARYTELAQSGYIFVMEDIRGRYGSEGQFLMNRPIVEGHDPNSSDPNKIDESTDAYDTVAWLIKNVPNNNGRVGVVGISYPGFLAMEAGIDAHPAVKAVSPQAPMTNLWIGDDFFHNGAFRQTYGYDYAIGLESSKENAFGKLNEDAYDYFLKGSFAASTKSSGAGDLPSWQAFFTHPAYDAYWQSRAVEKHLNKVTVPVLEVGGWWDQEDMWGP